MLRELTISERSFPLVAPFRIARGVKYAADVVTVELHQAGRTGRGESVPYARYGESMASVLDEIESLRAELAAGMGRDELQLRLPPGAARNALDAAMWDLDSQLSSVPVWVQLGRPPRATLRSAITLSIDTPARMGEAAARIADAGLIKIKVDADDPAARIEAVRQAAPRAHLIVDPNESWTIDILRDLQPLLERAGVELLEQPLPADADEALLGFHSRIPICADEACHVTADLPRLRGRYQAVNIKLDKTGGLTEAWRLLRAARADGFKIMVGCMVCSSLGITPALEIAREAEFIDLDGPLWLQDDYADGVSLHDGFLLPPAPAFWGG
ncbi:dipeptide epimerase [Rhodanobacter sp. FDAARGOS 1247]|jgi:L-alanine-DL-glutamate epimerase-like enolase superfamily enzyme|uniref:N-acetyl-D-Glu racemase DgcA n=1 Tax=Rhodanobacter sp. FDAARGOS 1247 TaxID=2778082 RepID=UPI00194E5245|nr:N-acetyl-D-Glu racemase DgcA [Rhodanobacter sp. FDAARGOS 1247]QRP64828.1 dipeptide epimerase [Rhodanobacter sp. FDAARGOS 1247]